MIESSQVARTFSAALLNTLSVRSRREYNLFRTQRRAQAVADVLGPADTRIARVKFKPVSSWRNLGFFRQTSQRSRLAVSRARTHTDVFVHRFSQKNEQERELAWHHYLRCFHDPPPLATGSCDCCETSANFFSLILGPRTESAFGGSAKNDRE